MRLSYLKVFLLLPLLFTTACSSLNESVSDSIRGYFESDDTGEKPAPLTTIVPTATVREAWSAQVGSDAKKLHVRLQPAVDGDRIYAAGIKGRVSAYEVSSGRLLWQVDTKSDLRGGPGVGNGLVLLGTADAEIIALDRETGAERWRALASSEVLAAPQAEDGVVVARSIDGRLFGFASDTGKRLWIYDSSVPVLTLRGTSAAMIFAGGVIAGLANGKLVALRLRDGALLWETRVAVPRGRSELERIVDIDADPIIIGGVVHVVTYQGNVATVALENGRGLWNRTMSSHAGIGADEQSLYVTDADSEIWSLERRSGSSFWKTDKLRARKLTAPVAFANHVVVGDLEGYVHFLKRDSGAFAARVRVSNSPIISVPTVAGDTLFISSSDGKLTALRMGN